MLELCFEVRQHAQLSRWSSGLFSFIDWRSAFLREQISKYLIPASTFYDRPAFYVKPETVLSRDCVRESNVLFRCCISLLL